MANSAVPVPSGSRSKERQKAADQPQLKGEGFEAGPLPFSSVPFATVAPLYEALLELTFPFLPFLDGPFAGDCRGAGNRPRNSGRGGQWHRGL
jgi:hypothetical protein